MKNFRKRWLLYYRLLRARSTHPEMQPNGVPRAIVKATHGVFGHRVYLSPRRWLYSDRSGA